MLYLTHQREWNYLRSRGKSGNAVKNTKLLSEVDIRFSIVRMELRKIAEAGRNNRIHYVLVSTE